MPGGQQRELFPLPSTRPAGQHLPPAQTRPRPRPSQHIFSQQSSVSPQQRPSPQFVLPFGQHFPLEQTSLSLSQHLPSPHGVSSFPHLHLPSTQGCLASQHVTFFVTRLVQHCSRGGQHLTTGPEEPAAPATLHWCQVFTQHRPFAGLAHVSLSSQHSGARLESTASS